MTEVSRGILENNVSRRSSNSWPYGGLELAEEKARVTHMDEGFDFLGQNVRSMYHRHVVSKSLGFIRCMLFVFSTLG